MPGQELRVPYAKDQVTGAPHVEADQGHLSPQEEAELYRYYGLHDGDDALSSNERPDLADTGV